MIQMIDWLKYYDTIAEKIDDDILDDADERFNIGISESLNIPDEYYIYCAQVYKERHQ
jgi:hypothetical protein